MYEIKDIYYYFRKAQAESNNRGFRIPKDFEKHLKNKMSKKNVEALDLCTKYFNTKWQNIDPYLYFVCGFEIFKNFTYTQFFNPKVINLYKIRDKIKKRDLNEIKTSILKSSKFVLSFMKENNITLIKYCYFSKNNRKIIIEHYLKNNICKFFISLLIKKGFLVLDDSDMVLIPYVSEQYREICLNFEDCNNFLEKIMYKLTN
jgi:hypothetical protein